MLMQYIDCSLVHALRITSFFGIFCDSFLCSISLLLLSDCLSCVLNSVHYMIVHIYRAHIVQEGEEEERAKDRPIF